jgi:hypothetical protein
MVRRNRSEDDREALVDRAPRARGGISPGAVLTGVVVTFGALFLLSAIIGGLLAATGAASTDVSRTDVVNAGIAGGIAFLIAWFLASLWGGYTAGRMGRGAGLANGLLVPLVVILVGFVIVAVAAVLGATAELNTPFSAARLPLEENYAVELGTGLTLGILVAMFLGGALGGLLGSRWHTKLERRAIEEVEGRHLSESPAAEPRREPAKPRQEEPTEPGRRPAEPRREAADDATTTRQPRT